MIATVRATQKTGVIGGFTGSALWPGRSQAPVTTPRAHGGRLSFE